MGGISTVGKKFAPNWKDPKSVAQWQTIPLNPKKKNEVWKMALNPLPYDGETPKQQGPVVKTGEMSAEEEEAVKRRRRKPATVLSTAGESDTLGG